MDSLLDLLDDFDCVEIFSVVMVFLEIEGGCLDRVFWLVLNWI